MKKSKPGIFTIIFSRLSALIYAQSECYSTDHYSVSPSVNTSGSEISAGPSPRLHLFSFSKTTWRGDSQSSRVLINATHVERPHSLSLWRSTGQQTGPGRVITPVWLLCAEAHTFSWETSDLTPVKKTHFLLDHICPDGPCKSNNCMLDSKKKNNICMKSSWCNIKILVYEGKTWFWRTVIQFKESMSNPTLPPSVSRQYYR